MRYLLRLCILLFVLTSTFVKAESLPQDNIPAPLQPWRDWVLQHEKDYGCPFFYNNFHHKHCSWPARLTLTIKPDRGLFNSVWAVHKADWITLPGNDRHWPQQVKVDNAAAVVIKQQGKPALYLQPGRHEISGQFFWNSIPDNLALPDSTGLLTLTVNDKVIAYPAIKNNQLWLKNQDTRTQKAANIQNRLDLQVFRKIIDDVPLQLTTFLELEISGDQREIVLPHALLQDFIPIALNSPLPARLEENGGLRMQVRPGRWHIELKARHPEMLTEIAFAVSDKTWPQAEVWSFEGKPYQRLAEVTFPPAIDPSQTNVPSPWQPFPAYRIEQGQRMQFNIIRRGDPEPEPNQLTLQRRLWLDFAGSGYTVEDRINGKMTHDWRLDALTEMQPGQAKLDGRNLLITRRDENANAGVEVRKGRLDLVADSRIENAVSHISAVGWQQDFSQVNAELNIPPGWRLLAASGVDNDPDSWLTRWTLLDLFLVLIAALAISRLWNGYWGVFALFSLALLWHETDAPRLIWLNILAALALLSVLPAGRMQTIVKIYRNLCWLGLIVIIVPFMINQVRIGLYPQLERQWQTIVKTPYPSVADSGLAAPQALEEVASMSRQQAPAKMRKNYSAPVLQDEAQSVNFDRIDPDAKVQTGPGLPQWHWHSVRLSWNGRVQQGQMIELWYLSPPVTMALNFLRVAMVLILSLLMFGAISHSLRLRMPVLSMILLVPLLGGLPAGEADAAFPSQAMLDELKQRLLQAPDCLPECAQIADLQITIDERQMTLQLEAHAQQHSAIPLPADADHWFPSQVTVDGKQADALLRQRNQLWLQLPQGRHLIELRGNTSSAHKFTLPLPLQPRRVNAQSRGWRIDGLHDDGRSAGQLQFTRLKTVQQQQSVPALQQTTMPPFVRIERTLHLGLDWRIETRVISLEPSSGPVILQYPLLPGESVTSANVRVNNNQVLINMASGQRSFHWQSILDKSSVIALSTQQGALWTETWRADVSPTWHLETEGIAVVHHQDRQGRWLPEWRPWQNETVRLHITRPAGVAGSTLTIDQSKLQVMPGKRSTENRLELQIRSSKGTQHTLTLPEKTILQSVTINGTTQPIRQQANTVTVPLKPGRQQIGLTWHENTEQPLWLTSPRINLGSSSVNSHINIISGRDRWVLLTVGPKFGPAALIWGVLLVLAMVSIGLGRFKLTPLKHWHWFLLLIGLSQIPVVAGLLVVAWLMTLGIRQKHLPANATAFNSLQVGLAGLTLIALLLLFFAVQQGLLGSPDMQIAGNQSSAYNLNWYQDRSDAWLPTASVLTVPLLTYRILMLLWSLWLAVSLLRWLKWGWQCFSSGGLWQDSAKKPAKSEEEKADKWTA